MRKMFSKNQIKDLIKEAIATGEISAGRKLYKHTLTSTKGDYSRNLGYFISDNNTKLEGDDVLLFISAMYNGDLEFTQGISNVYRIFGFSQGGGVYGESAYVVFNASKTRIALPCLKYGFSMGSYVLQKQTADTINTETGLFNNRTTTNIDKTLYTFTDEVSEI